MAVGVLAEGASVWGSVFGGEPLIGKELFFSQFSVLVAACVSLVVAVRAWSLMVDPHSIEPPSMTAARMVWFTAAIIGLIVVFAVSVEPL